MISSDRARDLVDERLQRLGDAPEPPMEAVRLTALGTDVNGVELQREIEATVLMAVRLMAAHKPGAVLAGVLTRMFWLGFEYGREEGS